MLYWLIHAGEPLPIDGDVRLFRYGILSSMLAERGHDAVQWAGTFDHFSKRSRASRSKTVQLDERRQIQLLHGRGYRRHIGLARIRTNREVAREFRRRAGSRSRPDVVIVSVPTLELAEEALEFGRRNAVPIVVDVRDLWPDVFVQILPPRLQPIGRTALLPLFRQVQRICRGATALVGVSQAYLDWGLRQAGRSRRSTDRVFSHAYQQRTLTDEQSTAVQEKLAVQGVQATAKVRFCFFGTLGRSCGLESVIKAVRRLAASEQQLLEIIICGAGPRLAEYQRMAADLESIRFLGWLSSSELIALMELSDVGLALYGPHAPQSLPNKPIEYLAGGLPVLSTLTGELQTLLDEYDCGLTVPPNNVTAMVSALRLFVHHESARARLASNSRNLFEQRFSAEQVYAHMIDYLEALPRRASCSARNLAFADVP